MLTLALLIPSGCSLDETKKEIPLAKAYFAEKIGEKAEAIGSAVGGEFAKVKEKDLSAERPQKITYDTYAKLRPGMTMDECRTVLGKRGEPRDMEGGSRLVWIQDEPFAMVSVGFRDGKAVEVEQIGLSAK